MRYLLVPAVVAAVLGTPLSAQQANPAFQQNFPVTLSGDIVRFSSIALGDLNNDGIPEIVVGGADGVVHAYLGTGTKLWDFDTGNMAIEGKAAIGDVNGDGFNEVVIGAGSTFTPSTHGGLYVLSHQGAQLCEFMTSDTGPADGFRDGVYASPALADLDQNDDGKLEIVFGGFDFFVRVINHDCSLVWEDFVRDTIFSSPAIGDIDKDGQLEIVIGAASHQEGSPFNTLDGGLLLAYEANGTRTSGFPIQIDEVIQSSPALGDIDGDGNIDIVVGTGRCWSNPACAPPPGGVHPGVGEYINAWDNQGNSLSGWPVSTSGHHTFASPALADLDEDGLLEVIVNTKDPSDNQGGLLYALNGNGSLVSGWPVQPTTPAGPGSEVTFQTSASPIVADINGDDHLEVILPSNFELVVWDRQGNQLTRDSFPTAPGALQLITNYTLSGAAGVGDIDGDGDVEVIVAGGNANPPSAGSLYAWDFSSATPILNPWPVFRANVRNTGTEEAIFEDGFESGDLTRWSSSQ